MSKQCIRNIQNIPAQQLMEGFKGRFIHSKKMTIAFWSVEPNKQLLEHSHYHEQITYIQKGEFELTLDKEIFVMKQNDIILIPSNVIHSGRSLTYCELIDMFSPPREDLK